MRIEYLVVHSWPVQVAGGALLTVLVTWAATLFLDRKRVGWRAYVDAPVDLAPAVVRSLGPKVSYEIQVAGVPVDKPSLAVLRVRNAGFVTVHGKDFNTPLTFTFPGRRVLGAEVTESSGDSPEKILAPLSVPVTRGDSLTRHRAAGRPRWRWPRRGQADAVAKAPGEFSSQVTLSKDWLLNRGDRFAVLVLLSGTPAEIVQEGSLDTGRIVKEDPRRGPATLSLVFGALVTLPLVGLLLGLFLSPGATQPSPSACAGGNLLLEGSTAFAPAATAIAADFESACHGAHIAVGGSSAVTGSVSGLNSLIASGDSGQAAGQIAMSDGPAPAGGPYQRLVGVPVGVVVFTVVVNRATKVYNLSSAQVRDIFNGTIVNWHQLGGPNLPVDIVSRYPGSGSRRAFDRYVLGGTAEPQPSSFDCTDKDAVPSAPVVLCEEPSTSALLDEVAHIPGAIGYAETSDVAAFTQGSVQPVQLDAIADAFGNVGNDTGSYRFWAVEYLYTYGSAPADSLAAEFLGYMDSFAAKDALRTAGYIPCDDGRQDLMSTLCAPAAH